MNAPDWGVLTPAHKVRWEQIQERIERMERLQAIEDLKFVREMRRTIERDAVLHDIEPVGVEICDEMIETLMGRLL